MRKKSHLSLASYMLDKFNLEDVRKHKKSFYFGSILPDCVPSFVVRRHNVEKSFVVLKKEIEKLTDRYDFERGAGIYYWRHIGTITHYLADYCTYPHNSVFNGGFKAHCRYENKLKVAMKSYIKDTGKKSFAFNDYKLSDIKSADDIIRLIKSFHERYLRAVKSVMIDCEYSLQLCILVFTAIFNIFIMNTGCKKEPVLAG